MYILKKENIIFLHLIFTNFGCESKRDAIGSDNEIRVICSDIDKDKVESFLALIFNDSLYTPEPEPFYVLKFSEPESYSKLKKQTNVVIAAIDRDSTNAGLKLIEKILPDKQRKYMVSNDPIILAKNVHANHQLFMVINANSYEHLLGHVDNKRNYIKRNFNEQFIVRQTRFLFSKNNINTIRDSLLTEFGWSLDLPWGWDIVKKVPDSNFVWLGREMPYQWIGIGWSKGSILNSELEVGKYIWEWPKKNYKTVQFSEYKFDLKKADNDKFSAWRATGIWETSDLIESKGGPFRSYVFYDNKKDLTYHLNYLIFHPGKSKSIFLRQADMILKSFKTH
tara:strand:+ start:1184 stop:2194 length:1011 start_codon:yes stop_codon:yes gene_type:complete